MISAAPGVFRRAPGEPRAPRYRRKPEPRDVFHVEAADAAMREAEARKYLANRLRPR